ncbi:hypothetical protein JT358_00555 [Micrococcales bacterium 31B]|nr:hypothetical protein [Micrococcales bacterium 31B]
MSTQHRFRRPASLSPAFAEQVPGDPSLDPAERNAMAHSAAAALLRDASERPDPEVIERIVRLVRDEGIDLIAEMWSVCAPVSLPGAMWRLFTVHTMVQSNPHLIAQSFAAGREVAPVLDVLAGVEVPPGPGEVSATIDQILRGAFTGDFAIALERAAALCLVVAFGEARLEAAELLDVPSARGGGGAPSLEQQRANLVRIGESLQHSARQWRAGQLH